MVSVPSRGTCVSRGGHVAGGDDVVAAVGGFGDDHQQVSADGSDAEDFGGVLPAGDREAGPGVEGLLNFVGGDVVPGDVGFGVLGPPDLPEHHHSVPRMWYMRMASSAVR